MDSKLPTLCVDVIIKFGGSAVTKKEKFETLIPENLQNAAKYIKKLYDSGLKCVVIHGAGSFGHHQAKQYEVNKGLLGTPREDKEKLMGYCLTRQSVTKLNKLVVDSLLEAGVPATSCSPGSSWETKDRIPVHWPSSTLEGLLSKNLVPVLHGDCCLDEALGCCILSGDTVIQTLCSHFTVKKVIFLTDVDGVFDRPPSEPGASLMQQICVQKDGTLVSKINTSQSAFDVTGGISLKLKSACDIVTRSQGLCQVIVCSVNFQDLEAVCQNGPVDGKLRCTVICLENT